MEHMQHGGEVEGPATLYLGRPGMTQQMIALLIDDAITLTSDGTWSQSGHSRFTANGKVTTESYVARATSRCPGRR